ncbi:MAG: amino acid ABC transporter substrate-binding protein [Treponema sp.]|nr:amino acid ABC transporter substrate-binding protein [Treponema sp.]
MKKSLFALFLTLCFCSIFIMGCSKNKQAAVEAPKDAVAALKARGELIIGYDIDFPPLAFKDGNGELVGYDVELAKEVANRMGVEFKAVPIAWEDKDNELENGDIDCIWSGYTITDARRKAHCLTFAYLSNEQVLIVRKTGSVQKYDDLEGRVIGYRGASSSEDAVNENPSFKNKLGDILTYKDNKSCLEDLKVGAIDAMVMDGIFAYYYVTHTNEPFTVIPTPLSNEKYCICFRKNEPDLRNYVEEILMQMAADGTVEKISTKWFGQDVSLIGK